MPHTTEHQEQTNFIIAYLHRLKDVIIVPIKNIQHQLQAKLSFLNIGASTTSYSEWNISNILQTSMFVMAVIATLMIIFGMFGAQQKYVSIILLAYLLYFLVFKLRKIGETTKTNYGIVGTLQYVSRPIPNYQYVPYTNMNAKNKDNSFQSILSDQSLNLQYKSRHKSQFLNDYEKLNNSMEASKKMLGDNSQGINQNQKSYLSFLNRSGKSSGKKSKENVNDQGFSLSSIFTNRVQAEKMTQSKISKDSYIRKTDNLIKSPESIKKSYDEVSKQCQKQYLQTLKQLKIQPNQMQENITEIKKLCLKIVKDIYQTNVINLKNIIHLLENNFMVQVDCDNFDDIDVNSHKYRYNSKERESSGKNVTIYKLLTTLIQKFPNRVPYTLRKKGPQDTLPLSYNSKSTQSFREKLAQFSSNPNQQNATLPPQLAHKLQQSIKQRMKLDQMLIQPFQQQTSHKEILQKLKTLQEYIQIEQSSSNYYHYETQYGHFKNFEQNYERRMAAFNVVRHIINFQVVQGRYKEYALNFEREFLFGFLSKSVSKFTITKAVLPLTSIQHNNLKYIDTDQSGKKICEQFFSKFGSDNIYVLIYYHLWAIYTYKYTMIRNNYKLHEIIQKCLGIPIL